MPRFGEHLPGVEGQPRPALGPEHSPDQRVMSLPPFPCCSQAAQSQPGLAGLPGAGLRSLPLTLPGARALALLSTKSVRTYFWLNVKKSFSPRNIKNNVQLICICL